MNSYTDRGYWMTTHAARSSAEQESSGAKPKSTERRLVQFRLDDELHRELRVLTAETGTSVQELMTQLVKQALSKSKN